MGLRAASDACDGAEWCAKQHLLCGTHLPMATPLESTAGLPRSPSAAPTKGVPNHHLGHRQSDGLSAQWPFIAANRRLEPRSAGRKKKVICHHSIPSSRCAWQDMSYKHHLPPSRPFQHRVFQDVTHLARAEILHKGLLGDHPQKGTLPCHQYEPQSDYHFEARNMGQPGPKLQEDLVDELQPHLRQDLEHRVVHQVR